MSYNATSAVIAAFALGSTFIEGLYKSPAQVVLISTALLMWSIFLIVLPHFSDRLAARFVSVVFSGAVIASILGVSSVGQTTLSFAFALSVACIVIAIAALGTDNKFAYASAALIFVATAIGLASSKSLSEQPIVSALIIVLLAIEFSLIRQSHLPVVRSLNEALERAEIFSTITKSSREFHSREPEEAIRNIVNVTKALGYISVSVVSFDRRQKIFEDGVPIPNVMDIAVRASATRRVTITKDENQSKNPRARQGDIVGVPIWINGRYSAALIVQTSSYVKVSQRDCEALELLADQAGRALENAGKAAMDRRVVERLTDESQRDKLTGLGNRRFADSMVASMRPGDVLAMVDLDGLKQTNDVHGHAAGDDLLHGVGVFLAEQIRNPDMAARLGGDEFMILLRNADEGAPKSLERLLVLWEQKKMYDTTFSMGMAVHRADRTTSETVEAADDALYEAKNTGKNRLVCATVS